MLWKSYTLQDHHALNYYYIIKFIFINPSYAFWSMFGTVLVIFLQEITHQNLDSNKATLNFHKSNLIGLDMTKIVSFNENN